MRRLIVKSKSEGETFPNALCSLGWLRGSRLNKTHIRGFYFRLVWPEKPLVTYRDFNSSAYLKGRISKAYLLYARVPAGRRLPVISLWRGIEPYGQGDLIATEEMIIDGRIERPKTAIEC